MLRVGDLVRAVVTGSEGVDLTAAGLEVVSPAAATALAGHP